LGSSVKAGQPAGQIHTVWEPASPARVVHYACDGMVFARRQPGRVIPGNCCMVVAAPL
jgi:predicted deacylase